MLYITLGVSAASYAFVYSTLVALAPSLALLRAQPWRKLQTMASMAATLAIARSPASMVSPCFTPQPQKNLLEAWLNP